MKRILFLCLGCLCVCLAAIGVILPLVPTTPFLLLAAYLFSQSSERFHQILLEHRIFGPIIHDWHEYGVIRLRVKWTSTILMLLMIAYPLVFMVQNNWMRGTIMLCMLAVLSFIWSRPSMK